MKSSRHSGNSVAWLTIALAVMLALGTFPAHAADRQYRMVNNLIAGVKMPFPEKLRNNVVRTEQVRLDTNAATVDCLRLEEKVRWCYEHIAPAGARAEMLRIGNEPAAGPIVGQLYH